MLDTASTINTTLYQYYIKLILLFTETRYVVGVWNQFVVGYIKCQ